MRKLVRACSSCKWRGPITLSALLRLNGCLTVYWLTHASPLSINTCYLNKLFYWFIHCGYYPNHTIQSVRGNLIRNSTQINIFKESEHFPGWWKSISTKSVCISHWSARNEPMPTHRRRTSVQTDYSSHGETASTSTSSKPKDPLHFYFNYSVWKNSAQKHVVLLDMLDSFS